jgi:hypothetical protein
MQRLFSNPDHESIQGSSQMKDPSCVSAFADINKSSVSIIEGDGGDRAKNFMDNFELVSLISQGAFSFVWKVLKTQT